MEFLVLFLPFAVAVLVAGIHGLRVERRLFRIVRARYPAEIEAARGRARRWYDGPEELDHGLRRALRARLRQRPAREDREVGDALVRVDRADRIFRRAALGGALVSAALLVVVRFLLPTPPP